MRYIALLIFIACLFACSNLNIKEKEQPVARVLDKYLYVSDLKDIVPAGTSREDSVVRARDFIDKWIQKQLLLNRAKLNLSKEKKDFSRQLEEYRTSLMIYRYEEEMIQQKLDTTITREQIAEYYEQYNANFKLQENIVKSLFIQLPVSAPNIEKATRLCQSDKEEDNRELIDYCYQFATRYDFFDDAWIPFSAITKDLPGKIENEQHCIVNNRFFRMQDSTHYYLVRIFAYKLSGNIAPESYVKEKIKTLIRTKRKIHFLKELEKDIYNSALNHKQFEIY